MPAAATPGYTALREKAAWIDLSARGKIRATGDDRARLLHAMVTNEVQKLHPGQGCYAFFLNAQGRILADANLLCMKDSILIGTEPETRQKVLDHLDKFIIADDVTLTDETDHWATISVEGPNAESVMMSLDASAPAEPSTFSSWGTSLVIRMDSSGCGGYIFLVPIDDKHALVDRLTAAKVPQATLDDARIVRIEHGKPRYGEEITERYLVQETGQMHAVSFTKGCYLGQEIVERVRSRAQIHRMLKRITIQTETPPAPGAKLLAGDADAGEIASAVYSPGLKSTVSLAYVRTPQAEPGTELTCEGARARVS